MCVYLLNCRQAGEQTTNVTFNPMSLYCKRAVFSSYYHNFHSYAYTTDDGRDVYISREPVKLTTAKYNCFKISTQIINSTLIKTIYLLLKVYFVNS